MHLAGAAGEMFRRWNSFGRERRVRSLHDRLRTTVLRDADLAGIGLFAVVTARALDVRGASAQCPGAKAEVKGAGIPFTGILCRLVAAALS